MAGLESARAKGKMGGRKKSLSTKEVNRLRLIYDQREMAVQETSEFFNISKITLYKYLKE